MKQKFLEGVGYSAGIIAIFTGCLIGVRVAERTAKHIKEKIREHKKENDK